MLQTNLWLNKIIFTSDEINNAVSLNDYFGMNGYQSMDSIMNLGSTFVFLIMFLMAQFLLAFIKIFRC